MIADWSQKFRPLGPQANAGGQGVSPVAQQLQGGMAPQSLGDWSQQFRPLQGMPAGGAQGMPTPEQTLKQKVMAQMLRQGPASNIRKVRQVMPSYFNPLGLMAQRGRERD